MRIRAIALAAVLGCSSWIAAQSTAPQTPPAGAQGQSAAGREQGSTPAGNAGMHHTMSQNDMAPMHAREMEAMRQQVAKMQTLLDQMKANVDGLSGANKTAMQANVQLWQMMIDHMKQMVQHMSSMGGMMMQPRGMGAGPGHPPHPTPGQPGAPGTGEKPAQGEQTNNPPPQS